MNTNTSERPAVPMVRLVVGAHFVLPEQPSQVWVKTGQRSARPCHYTRLPVRRFQCGKLVQFYELQEVL
jgi:hypothetical protein